MEDDDDDDEQMKIVAISRQFELYIHNKLTNLPSLPLGETP